MTTSGLVDADVAVSTATFTSRSSRSDYSGLWLSRYEYFSTDRNATLDGLHFVVVHQDGGRLRVQSVPGAESPLTMDLTIVGDVITGSWVEETAADGYYQGAHYHGAIQLLMNPTGWRMVGRWIGLGPDPVAGDPTQMDVNSGRWELLFLDSATDQDTIDRYSNRGAI